jgi:peptidyl-prolyl cis-trans isomerase D
MLDFLRRGVKSWVAKILLALLIVSFAVWGIGDIFVGGRGAAVAVAGESEVDAERFANAVLRQQSQMSQQAQRAVTFQDMQAAGVGIGIAELFRREATFAEELRTLDIAVPDDSIREMISENPNFQNVGGTFDRGLYERAIGLQRFTPRQFEALVADELGRSVLANAVSLGVSTPPGVAEAITTFDGEQRQVASISLPAADAADPGQPDAGALGEFFAENQERFREPERRWGSYLHTDLSVLLQTAAPSEEDIEAEYTANPDSYTLQASRTVEQIVFDDRAAADAAASRILQGEATFEEIAAEQNLSLDDASLGVVRIGDLAETTEAAVFALEGPGLAGSSEGVFGPILLNVSAVELGGLQPLDSVREAIRAVLTQRNAQDAADDALAKIEDLRAEGASMEELAAQTGLPLVRFGGLSAFGDVKEDTPPPLTGNPQFMREALESPEGEERELLQLEDGSYLLVMVERIEETYLPELDEVRAEAVEAWRQEARLFSQQRMADGLVQNGADLERIASLSFAGITEHPAAPRSASPAILSEDLVRAVFDADEGEVITGRSRDGQSVIVAEVRAVTPLSEEDMTTQVNEITVALGGSMERDHLEFYARALEARHGAIINTESIANIFQQLSGSGQSY